MEKGRAIGRSAWILAGAGAFIGIVAALLVKFGNPGNMGVCIACFLRDITGYFVGGITNQGAVSYIRPEIVGIILGSFGAAVATREFRTRGGSSTLLRFFLGAVFMMSALIFLGCTVRVWLRLGAGDLNALWGVAGIVAGVVVGIVFLKRGFSLGRAKTTPSGAGKYAGWIVPIAGVMLLVFALLANTTGFVPSTGALTKANAVATGTKPPVVMLKADGEVSQILKPADVVLAEDGSILNADGTEAASAEQVASAKPQPGGKRAPLWISLVAGLAIGVVAQRSRFCSIGGIRDAILVRRYDLLFGIGGLLIANTIANLVLGQYNLGFEGQPVAHTDALGNFASMTVAALAAMLLGGCPFRQVVMSAEGDWDAGVAVAGMLVGAGVSHYFGLASSAAGLAPNAWVAMAVMFAFLVGVSVFFSRSKTA